MDTKKIIESLSINEVKILPYIEEENIEVICEKTNLEKVSVLRALEYLKNKKILTLSSKKIKVVEIGVNGALYRKKGLPERRFMNILKEKIDVLLLNQSQRMDATKQRNSGFNHVLAKIAKKKNAEIGINFDEIISLGKKRKVDILGRVIQNVKLCNKNKLTMKFVSLKNKSKINIYDVKSLGLVLGMPTWMTKNLNI